jgi:hypothetical protein
MEQNLKSEGKCLFCGKTLAKTSINRHLKIHLDQKVTENPKGKSYSVKVEICTVHNWGEDSLFCDKCAKKHAKKCPDFEEYASMPVVNSPRMGVCAYTGGVVDEERDGVFLKTK